MLSGWIATNVQAAKPIATMREEMYFQFIGMLLILFAVQVNLFLSGRFLLRGIEVAEIAHQLAGVHAMRLCPALQVGERRLGHSHLKNY